MPRTDGEPDGRHNPARQSPRAAPANGGLTTRARLVTLALLVAITSALLPDADGSALLRVERRTDNDRVMLIESRPHPGPGARIDAFLALGDADRRFATGSILLGRDGMVVEANTAGWTYFAFLPAPQRPGGRPRRVR